MSAADRMRAAILAETARWLGTPYRHQASRRGIGCDCLGLVLGVWREVHGVSPAPPATYSPDWAEAGEDRMLIAARMHCREIPAAEARPGDLVLFRWRPQLACRHAGILMPEDRFAHAYQGSAVVISAMVPQWRRRIAAIFSFPVKEL